MISHSTRAKRRIQARNWRLSTLTIRSVDRRWDFWLVSYPLTKPQPKNWFDPYWAPQYRHVEVYGMAEASRVYGRIRQHILSGGS